MTYYHLQELTSGTELIQALQKDDYARQVVARARCLQHSTFCDTVNDRGVEQLLSVLAEHIRQRQNCTLASI